MANPLNALDCSVVSTHIAKAACDVKPKVFKKLLGTPDGTTFTNTELAAMQATLTTGLTDNTFLSRFLLIDIGNGIEDNSEEAQQYTYGDGSTELSRSEVYRWTFEHKVGHCYHKNLRKLNNAYTAYDWFFIDKDNMIWGVYDGVNKVLAGYDFSYFYAQLPKVATYSDPTRYMLTIEMADSTQFGDFSGNAKLSFNPSILNGVQGVDASSVSSNWTTGAFTISLYSGCGGLNLATLFPTALAATGAFRLTNTQTGVTIPITSVTKTTVNSEDVLIVDADQTDANFTAIASGQSATLDLATVSALTALGVSYYELNSKLTLTKP